MKLRPHWLAAFAVLIILGVSSGADLVQASATFTKTLALGSSGAAVTSLQTLLTTQQVYTGPITGYFGTLTRDGVKTLQAKFGLDTVGTVGPKTRALLNQLATASTTTPLTMSAATTPAGVSTDPSLVPEDSVASVIGSSSRTYKRYTRTTKIIPTTTPVVTTTTVTQNVTTPAPSTPTVTPTPILAPVPTPTPVANPTTTAAALQWGVFPGNSTLSSVESLVGKQANIEAVFTGFGDSFPTYLGSVCAGNPNKTLLVFWENYGYSLDNIIAGTYDANIRSFAQQAASYQCPVIISLFHEMNGNWDSWDGTMPGNSPAKVIAAWKHVHDLFTAANVTNVKWAWAVNNVSVPDVAGNQYSDYYPGDAYVDYVGIDGFNFGNPWQTFGQVFDAGVAKLQVYNKPIYIFSMSSTAGTQKAAWITEGLGTHIKTYPNVKGWVWFDMQASDGNWLLNSDTPSLAAFKSVLP